MKNYLLLLVMMKTYMASAQDSVTLSQIAGSEKMSGLSFSQMKRDSMTGILTDKLKTYRWLHAQNLSNDVPLPIWFNPVLPGMVVPRMQMPVHFTLPDQVALPADRNQLAFYSIPQLASLIKRKKITCEQVTRFSLDELEKDDGG